MPCRGLYLALTPDQEPRLLACLSDDEVIALVQEIEEEWDEEHLCQTDKAWDAIHRVLGDDERVVLGGKSLYEGDEYIVTYLTASDVAQLAPQLQPIPEEWFRERYFALKASDYADFVSEEDFGYSWEYFQCIRKFFQQSAQQNRPIIFTVDQ